MDTNLGMMKNRVLLCGFLVWCIASFLFSVQAREVLIVVGLGGEAEYQERFRENVAAWTEACQKAGVPCEVMGSDPKESGLKEKLSARLSAVGEKELWLVLIGHGTYDSRVAKFNIAGADFTPEELAGWCKPISGDLVVINTASASGPFLSALAGKKRTIITATMSANEINYCRFGEYFSKAVGGIKAADLDNDDQVSLLEAYLYSSHQVVEFYEQAGRIATEHALIDDNGDGLGTRSEWFEGVSAVKMARDGAEPDGLRAMQQVLVPNALEKNFPPELLKTRDELETRVRLLQRKKTEMAEAEYYRDLEGLLRELALIYQQVETLGEK